MTSTSFPSSAICTGVLLIAGLISIVGFANRAFGLPFEGSITIYVDNGWGGYPPHYARSWGTRVQNAYSVADNQRADDLYFSASGSYSAGGIQDPDGYFTFACVAGVGAAMGTIVSTDVKVASADAGAKWRHRFRIDTLSESLNGKLGTFRLCNFAFGSIIVEGRIASASIDIEGLSLGPGQVWTSHLDSRAHGSIGGGVIVDPPSSAKVYAGGEFPFRFGEPIEMVYRVGVSGSASRDMSMQNISSGAIAGARVTTYGFHEVRVEGHKIDNTDFRIVALDDQDAETGRLGDGATMALKDIVRTTPLIVSANKLSWLVPPCVSAVMQSSPDLISWVDDPTPVLIDIASRKAEFALPAIPTGAKRFYRLKLQLFVEDHPALAAYEGFDYPTAVNPLNPAMDGNLAANQGGTTFNSIAVPDVPNETVWGGAGVTPASGITNIVSGSLTWPGITSSGNRANFVGGSSESNVGRSLGKSVDSGTIYFRYLTRRNNSTAGTLAFTLFDGLSEKLSIGQIGWNSSLTTNGNFAVDIVSSGTRILSANPINYGTGITHLVVGRIDFNVNGALDRLRIYVDPTSLSDEVALSPYIDNSAYDFGAISAMRPYVAFDVPGYPAPSVDFDEIRFGLTFASVGEQ